MPRATKVAVLLVQGDFEVHKSGCQNIKKVMPQVQNYFTEPIKPGVTTQYDVVLALWADQIAESVGEGNHYATEEDAVHASYQHAVKFHDCLGDLILPMPAYKAPAGTTGKPGPDLNPPKRSGKAKPKTKVTGPTVPTPAERKAERETGAKAISKDKPAPQPVAASNGKLTRDQKRELATAVVRAAAEVLGDTVVLEGMNSDQAAKAVSHWLHHLPADRAAWPQSLPKPARSDWA